jgi:hypothetical protein
MPSEPAGDVADPSTYERPGDPEDSSSCGGPEPNRAWSLWNAGREAHAETGKHPLGCAVKVYMDGMFLFSMARTTCELAKQDADELKLAALASGWTDQPPTPVE